MASKLISVTSQVNSVATVKGGKVLKRFTVKQRKQIQKWIENPKVIPAELEQRNYEVVDRILLDYIKSLLNLEQVRA